MSYPNEAYKPIENDLFSDVDMGLYILLDHARCIIARSRELEMAQYGLTPEQAAVLFTLIARGGSAVTDEIADITMRQYNATSSLVNRMSKQGMVEKTKLADSKKFNVSITEKGRSLYSKVTNNSIKLAFSDLSMIDKSKLSEYLQILIGRGRKNLLMDQKLPFLG
jgi:DNA-binding MarR family transcriptional regulator